MLIILALLMYLYIKITNYLKNTNENYLILEDINTPKKENLGLTAIEISYIKSFRYKEYGKEFF